LAAAAATNRGGSNTEGSSVDGVVGSLRAEAF